MKWLFFLLLLANLVLAAWDEFGSQTSPSPLTRQEIYADRIKIAQPLQKPPAPAPAPVSAPTAVSAPLAVTAAAPVSVMSCYRWGAFSGDALDRARRVLQRLAPSVTITERSLAKAGTLGFWAYIPPAKSKKDALEKIRKLDALGIRDHFLIQETGKWQYAVSLGIFHTEDAAKRYAASVRGKGVKSAASARRDGGEVEFLIANLSESAASGLGKLDFPKTRIELMDCKAIRGKASPD